MDGANEHPPQHKISLAEGAQAVINGALVTALEPCELEVGAGSFVVTGRTIDRSRVNLRNPREELYFSILEASADEERFANAQFRLFGLLAQVVAQDCTYHGQRECAAFAAALMAGDSSEAVRCASRLASDRFEEGPRGANFDGRKIKRSHNRSSTSDLRA